MKAPLNSLLWALILGGRLFEVGCLIEQNFTVHIFSNGATELPPKLNIDEGGGEGREGKVKLFLENKLNI